MRRWSLVVAVALVCSGMPVLANAAAPMVGEYATKPGWGSLVIAEDKEGRRSFELFATGSNGHICELSGSLQGSSAITGDEPTDTCRMSFDFDGARVAVQAITRETCHSYCGIRADFEGDYSILAPACTPTVRERRKARFLADYKARRYASALAQLDSIGSECGGFFDWLEKDRFANDRAITLLHLGRPAECLAALAGTLVADSHDEESLDESVALPPTDRDMYLPIARATWFNRDRCKAAMKHNARKAG
jgi:hypothetical protein